MKENNQPYSVISAEYLMYLWNVSNNGETLSDAKLAAYIRDNLRELELKAMGERQKHFYERK